MSGRTPAAAENRIPKYALRGASVRAGVVDIVGAASQTATVTVNDTDRRCFLATPAEPCAKTGWQVHPYGQRAGVQKRPALVVVGLESRLQAVWSLHRLKPGLQTGILQRALMGKHFHPVMETPLPTLSDSMKWRLQTDTSRYYWNWGSTRNEHDYHSNIEY